jgi:hypothetical protein
LHLCTSLQYHIGITNKLIPERRYCSSNIYQHIINLNFLLLAHLNNTSDRITQVNTYKNIYLMSHVLTDTSDAYAISQVFLQVSTTLLLRYGTVPMFDFRSTRLPTGGRPTLPIEDAANWGREEGRRLCRWVRRGIGDAAGNRLRARFHGRGCGIGRGSAAVPGLKLKGAAVATVSERRRWQEGREKRGDLKGGERRGGQGRCTALGR